MSCGDMYSVWKRMYILIIKSGILKFLTKTFLWGTISIQNIAKPKLVELSGWRLGHCCAVLTACEGLVTSQDPFLQYLKSQFNRKELNSVWDWLQPMPHEPLVSQLDQKYLVWLRTQRNRNRSFISGGSY